ncbi:MAG: ABC transporter permease [Parcubacteria group bacterium]
MRFLDYIRMGFKNLWRQKLRSSLTIVAVVIGALSVVVMISLVIGVKSVFMQQMEAIGMLSQITVTGSSDTMGGGGLFDSGPNDTDTEGTKLDDSIVEKLEKISHVAGVSPSTRIWTFNSMKLAGQDKKFSPELTAYEPTPAFDKDLVAGRNLRPDDEAKIIIGGGALRKFGYEKNPEDIIGQKVILVTYEGYTGYGVDVPKPPQNADRGYWDEQQEKSHEIEAEIIGALPPGPGEQQSFTNMKWARELMTYKHWDTSGETIQRSEKDTMSMGEVETEMPMQLFETCELDKKGYMTILVQADSTTHVEEIAEEIKKLDLGATTAKDFLDDLMKILNVIGIILGAIGGVSLGVATIGIVNTMVMAIYERTREIGVMRACGASRGAIRKLFTFEAALLGLLGGLVGVAISFGLATAGNYFGNQYLAEQSMMIRDVVALPWWLIGGIVAFTTIVGLLAGLYPAFRAARLDPVEALRRE